MNQHLIAVKTIIYITNDSKKLRVYGMYIML